ncbi:glycosyltransferase [Pedobacter sp. N36a]|uniref:glycosyltransferase family 2 protein n=1 Tax=Pedobacter sp. N36a TaxID=2767996 RepID=UPI001656EE5F|nr:glycosyltransferase [Pedobacter sp. N36a]MBC8986502.1 glycosyltransferase [Pedobacter sp. N36a]
METNDQEVMVSVSCLTYNHEQYIAQAIEGFLMQKTKFKFEVLVGEDCSTDGTREIVEFYQKNYPEIIKMVTSEKNVGLKDNFNRIVKQAKGKYMAMCEGDDFWTDPYKLQKQIDFLEHNPDYIICCHYSKIIDQDGETLYVHPSPVSLEFGYEDILQGNKDETFTATLIYRTSLDVTHMGNQDWYLKCHAPDKFLKLYATAVTGKKIYVMPEVMSCYRKHVGGVWSMVDPQVIRGRMLSDFNVIIKNFKYPTSLKWKLLKVYSKNYLRHDIRHLQLNNAISTIKYLLLY